VDDKLALIGDDVMVPLVPGGFTRYLNFDYAASAPCLATVWDAVQKLLPWYSSVHRGAGYKSQICTALYEKAREDVRSFVGAQPEDCVIFTRNTTDALNLLAHALPPAARVVTWASEHHANLLPWQQVYTHVLPIPATPADALSDLEFVLRHYQIDLVAVTGASNVTGELWPIREIAALTRHYHAKTVLDAAQLAPHRAIEQTSWDIDFVAISGHKLYAPFGAGAMIGRRAACDWLETGAPMLRGGGAVDYVQVDEVLWTALPDRQEAGSPNVVGAVALGVACRTLQAAGLAALEFDERALRIRLEERLAKVPGLHLLRMWPLGASRIGVVCWVHDKVPYATQAAVLSAEHGAGVRHGCLCAHPLVTTLLNVDPITARALGAIKASGQGQIPGVVRASIGLGTTEADVDALVHAVEAVCAGQITWTYQSSADGTQCWPINDPREMISDVAQL
jgi:selenocysteine lyase/cysteine desulfurase